MKAFVTCLFLLFFPIFSYAAQWNAQTCELAEVQSKVTSALNGDTVMVPAGNCTWNSALSLTKTITLRGAGPSADGTKITYGGINHTLFSVGPNTTGYMDISGFWLLGGDGNYWSGTAMQLYGPVGWKNLRVHNMVFDGNKQWSIKGGAYTNGVIDNCTFKGSAHGIMLYGQGTTDWATPLTLGTADFFFIDNNTFNWNDWFGSSGAASFDLDKGGRVVFRYNTVKYSIFETHDRVRSSLASGQAYEVYNNTFWTDISKWKAVDISGGTGVIWGNTIYGPWSVAIGGINYKSFTAGGLGALLCDGNDPADQNIPGESGWRCQYQIGTLYEGASAISYPLYVWNNKVINGSGSNGLVVTNGGVNVKTGRDYFNNVARPGYTPYIYPHPLTQKKPLPPPNVRILN